MAIWLFFIAKYLLAIWRNPIAKCTVAIWRHPIAKHSLAILATSYCLNRNDRVSSFYKNRGSKLCFLTCFCYFSRYFHILVFLRICFVLISSCPFVAAQESDFLSRFLYLGTPSLYIVHVPPYFWNRTCGILEARRSWEPGSRLTTGEIYPFPLFTKGFWCKRPLDKCGSYLSYSQKSLN
jgi:hypothetical protein